MAEPTTPPETPAQTPPANAGPKNMAEAKERIAALEAQLAATREEADRRLRAQRDEFDAAWQRREEELRATPAPREVESLPRGPLARGRIARFEIHCHDAEGRKLAIPRGKPIPEGANLDGVDPAAIVEEG